MYNGIGLASVRGSGTNGYVQKNLSYISQTRLAHFRSRNQPQIIHKPKEKILDRQKEEYNARRKVELEMLDYKDELREKGYTFGKLVTMNRYSDKEIEVMAKEEKERR